MYLGYVLMADMPASLSFIPFHVATTSFAWECFLARRIPGTNDGHSKARYGQQRILLRYVYQSNEGVACEGLGCAKSGRSAFSQHRYV